jgi:hypothetical protein
MCKPQDQYRLGGNCKSVGLIPLAVTENQRKPVGVAITYKPGNYCFLVFSWFSSVSQWEQKHLLAVPPLAYVDSFCFHTWFSVLAACFMVVSYLAYSLVQKMEVICSSESSADFYRLHGTIFQKIKLFI